MLVYLIGLIETVGESIKYPIFPEKQFDSELDKFILAGPTCDSMDILYQYNKIELPVDLNSRR